MPKRCARSTTRSPRSELPDFTIQLNSRRVLAGLLEAFGVPPDLGPGALISLDKLDKLPPDEVVAELIGRGLAAETAGELVAAMTAPDAAERIRGCAEQDRGGHRRAWTRWTRCFPWCPGRSRPGASCSRPRMVRGLSYYTGPIWEVAAPGVAGSIGSGGRYDHLIEQLGGPDVPATGSSIGIERIMPLLPAPRPADARPPRRRRHGDASRPGGGVLRLRRGGARPPACGPASTWGRPASSAGS